MDAFDRFWQWANKPPESSLAISTELHRAVMELAPEERTGPRRGKSSRSMCASSRTMNALTGPSAFTRGCRHRN
jgi:hypothetical protein